MLSFLRSIFAPPRDRRQEGYTFAKTWNGPRADLENFVDGSKMFGAYDDFDRGIDDFLKEPANA